MSSEEKQTESASFFQELGSFMKPYSGKYASSVVVSILGVAANLAAYGFVGIIAREIDFLSKFKLGDGTYIRRDGCDL